MKIERKGIRFGEGAPVICVPVVERTDEAVLGRIRELSSCGVSMIEWRMDWHERAGDISHMASLLGRMEGLARRTALLCTFRSRLQGGEGQLDAEGYERLNLTVAESGVADLVDLEFYQARERERQIRRLQAAGTLVVCSHHDFEKTPAREQMEGQLMEMAAAGADFAKLAVMPRRKGDVLELMAAVLAVKERMPQQHVIAMSMGGDGAISRLLGGWYGSEVTFASLGQASAPGQLPYGKAKELIQGIAECAQEGP